jgi:hypothetical protein
LQSCTAFIALHASTHVRTLRDASHAEGEPLLICKMRRPRIPLQIRDDDWSEPAGGCHDQPSPFAAGFFRSRAHGSSHASCPGARRASRSGRQRLQAPPQRNPRHLPHLPSLSNVLMTLSADPPEKLHRRSGYSSRRQSLARPSYRPSIAHDLWWEDRMAIHIRRRELARFQTRASPLRITMRWSSPTGRSCCLPGCAKASAREFCSCRPPHAR